MIVLLSYLIKRRYCNVKIPILYQFWSESKKESQKQCPYMRPINICIGIMAANSAYSRYKVFIVFNRKIIYIFATTNNLFDISKDVYDFSVEDDENFIA